MREAVVNSNGFVAGVAPEVEVVDAFGTRDIFLLEVLLKLFFFLETVVLVTTVFWNATAGNGDIILPLARARERVDYICSLLPFFEREK